jgi:hypothetical protein
MRDEHVPVESRLRWRQCSLRHVVYTEIIVRHATNPERWLLESYQYSDFESDFAMTSQQVIRNWHARDLRLVASALAPGGNATQPLTVGSY